MTQPITCPARHRLRPQHSPGASFWVTAVSNHRRRRTLVDLRPSAPSIPPGQPDWGRHGCGEPPPRPLTSSQFLQREMKARALRCAFQVLERMMRGRTVYICRLQPVSEPEQPKNVWSIFFTLHRVIPEENAPRRCHGTGAARTEPIGSSELLQRPLFLINVRIPPSAGCQVGYSSAVVTKRRRTASTWQLNLSRNTPEEKCTRVLDTWIHREEVSTVRSVYTKPDSIPRRTFSRTPSLLKSVKFHFRQDSPNIFFDYRVERSNRLEPKTSNFLTEQKNSHHRNPLHSVRQAVKTVPGSCFRVLRTLRSPSPAHRPR